MRDAGYKAIKRIETIERLSLSVNGNPRFTFTFSDGTDAISSSDASFNYEVGNPGYRVGDLVEITFTRAGRIAYMSAVQR